MKNPNLPTFVILIISTLFFMSPPVRGADFSKKSNKTEGAFVAMWCGPNLTFKDGQWIQWDPESPKDVLYFVDRCSEGGIDRIYPSMGNNLYRSKITQVETPQWGDPLRILIKAAHSKGIEVHPYLAVFHNGDYFNNLPQGPQAYMSKSRNGDKDPHFLSPGYKEVRKRMVDLYMELLEDYDIDGIMLDYVRYHKANRGYDEPIIEVFKAKYGTNPHSVPDNDPNWIQVRADFVTKFIHELRAAMKSKKIDKPISVSAICTGTGTTKETLNFCYQDLQTWANEGLIDYFCPMAYTKDLEELGNQITNFTKNIKSKNKTVKVLGSVAPYEDRLCTPELLEEGAKVVLQSGSDGVCIYRGSSMEKYNLWHASKRISEIALPRP